MVFIIEEVKFSLMEYLDKNDVYLKQRINLISQVSFILVHKLVSQV